MKQFTIFILCFFAITPFSFSQNSIINYILNSKVDLTHQVHSNSSENILFVKTNFGSAEILNPDILKEIQNLVITKVELVFTTFKSTQTFDQKELNRKRLFSLQKYFPKLFENDLAEWKLIGQTGCVHSSQSENFFHGFRITFRPTPTDASIKKEIEYLDKILSKEKTESMFFGLESELELSDSTLLLEEVSSNYKLDDSAVIKVFNRNPDWKKMLVVCDFTGSMFPYTSQLLVWHKLNLEKNVQRIKYFTFFNDGNSKSTAEKIIGKTGGIYHDKTDVFEDVLSLAKKTMLGGGGGDTPENNVEALLEAIQKCNDCNEIIMIADNYATPRDLSLLSKIKKPVRIIMCGTYGSINPNYLDFALKTKGSIHTIEEDILNISKMSEGKIITIGKNQYQIKNGKFKLIKKM